MFGEKGSPSEPEGRWAFSHKLHISNAASLAMDTLEILLTLKIDLKRKVLEDPPLRYVVYKYSPV